MSESEALSLSKLYECPACGEQSAAFTDEKRSFLCGADEHAVTLSVLVPVGRCTECGLEFTDARAEKRRHDAYCQHLGRLKADEILELRQRYGLTRHQFSVLTAIGEASLSRWERGQSIQNAALDRLMYLLTFRDNFARLEKLLHATPTSHEKGGAKVVQLRCLDRSEAKIREGSEFQLRPTGT